MGQIKNIKLHIVTDIKWNKIKEMFCTKKSKAHRRRVGYLLYSDDTWEVSEDFGIIFEDHVSKYFLEQDVKQEDVAESITQLNNEDIMVSSTLSHNSSVDNDDLDKSEVG